MKHPNVLISMDGHTEGFVDLKPWLPRQYHDAFEEATREGKRVFHKGEHYFAALVKAGMDFGFAIDASRDFDPEQYDLKLTPQQRMAMLDKDGVAAELIIDGFGAISTDPELEHEITLAYTRWFRDTYLAADPYRFNAAVVVNLIGGMERMLTEVRYIHAHGLKAVHLPGNPRDASADLPHYNHHFYEPLWQLLNELEMVVIFHASVGREKPLLRLDDTEFGDLALGMMAISTSHQGAVAHLLLGGISERHPAIRFGWIESGCAWVAPLLGMLDMNFYAPTDSRGRRLGMKPSEQWRQSCFTAGPLGPGDLAARDSIGVETILFGSDFIHVEGTYPDTRPRLTQLLKNLTPDERYAVCTGNAVRLMGFDLDRLATTKAALQAWNF